MKVPDVLSFTIVVVEKSSKMSFNHFKTEYRRDITGLSWNVIMYVQKKGNDNWYTNIKLILNLCVKHYFETAIFLNEKSILNVSLLGSFV